MRPAGTTSKKRGADARSTFCTMCVWVPAAMRTMIIVNLGFVRLRLRGLRGVYVSVIRVLSEFDQVLSLKGLY